jgi:hypothetical protein
VYVVVLDNCSMHGLLEVIKRGRKGVRREICGIGRDGLGGVGVDERNYRRRDIVGFI